MKMLLRNLGKFAEQHYTVPFCTVLFFIGAFISPRFAGRKTHVCYRFTARCIAYFRFFTEMTNQNNFIDAFSHIVLSVMSRFMARLIDPAFLSPGVLMSTAPLRF